MKKILIVFFSALLFLFSVPQTVHAANPVTLTVKADKTDVNPGDTVNFTVSIGAVENLGGLDFYLVLPDGLTFMPESVVVPDGVFDTIDASEEDTVVLSGTNKRWCHTAQKKGYTGTSELVFVTFSCTVDDDAALGGKSVTLEMETCFDNTLEMIELETTIIPATVTVEKSKVAVTGVSLDKTELALKDGETAVLTATVSPADADNQKVSWSSDNTEVVSVTNGTVTAVKVGSANITVTTEDGNKTAVCHVTVTCNHVLTKTEAVAATCGKDGNIAYYTCSKCGKKYADAAGTTEVTNIVVPATGIHGETEIRDASEATEDMQGYTGDTYCKVCGNIIQTGTVIPKLPHTHAMNKIPAVAATCVEDGNIEYYICSKCGRMYADEAGETEVTDVVVKAAGHQADGIWKYDDVNHWQICKVCLKEVLKAEHSYSWVVDQAATEETTGLCHEECVCGAKRSEETVIPKLDHVHTDILHYPAVEATCMNAGSKEYWTCSSALCAGKYYGDADCQIEITEIAVPINPDNHVKDGEWETDAEKHSRICACGVRVDEGAHIYDNATDAFCNVCNYKRFYIVTDGVDAVYELNAAEGLTFRIDGELALFQSLEIDGVVVAAENYTLAEGSTIITLKKNYLNTLAVGAHDMKVVYSDGKNAVTSFRVQRTSTATDNGGEGDEENTNAPAESKPQDTAFATSPQTGDDGNFICWIGLLLAVLAAMAGIAGLTVYRKARR